VNVKLSGGKILTFGKEQFQSYDTERAPGGATKFVEFGYRGDPYTLEIHALNGKVPREHQREAQDTPGVDLGQKAATGVMRILLRMLEKQQADLATDASKYDNDHKEDLKGSWSDPASNPAEDIDGGKDAIRQTASIEPNLLVLSPKGLRALKNHPKIIDRFKYTTHEILTADMLSAFFEIDQVVVGKDIFTDKKGGKFQDTWGNNAILAYVAQPGGSEEEPSYGYTYAMEGHPLVEEPWYDETHKSWIYGVSFERMPVISGMLAGYLFQNPVKA
jgi:hypothetical protein